MNELVSIIMPSYNTANFIGETIKSVLEQTYKNWELLIVDDCSTDNTDEVVARYNDERITDMKNVKNSGAAVSRNKALNVARGKWIAFLDSDDLWYPTKLEEQIKYMEKNDYAMWLKIIKRANCYHYDKVLAQYRKRSGSISNHGYLKLIKWHYKLFKEADNKNSIISLLLTFQNLAYGCWKKIRYVKKVS